MKAISRSAGAVIVAALVLTGLNVGYGIVRDRLDAPKPLWEFPIGNRFPSAPLRVASGAGPTDAAKPIPTSCRLMVVFDTSCQYCHTAKTLEAGIPDSVRLPVVWLSMIDDPATARFADGLSPTSIVRVAKREDLSALTVRATPIAFLVSATGIVKSIIPYEGTEAQHRAVRKAC